jgi:hypothetical protein
MIEENIKNKIHDVIARKGDRTINQQIDDIYYLMKVIHMSMESESIAHQLKLEKELPLIIKDKRGNEVYHEDAKNNWYRFEYDEKNRITFCEFSNGGWYKYTYTDETCTYENSEGTIKVNPLKR